MTKQGWTMTSPLESDRFAWLDTLAEPLQKGLQSVFRSSRAGRQAQNVLNGVPVRHRIHPALIIAPLGSYTTAVVLDALDAVATRKGNLTYRKGADASVAFGLVSTVPTVAAGLADWADTYGHHRRVGMLHALLNVAATGLYSASFGFRLADKRGPAWALSGAGYALGAFSGMLGGEMTYNLGVNVPHYIYPKAPNKWTDVLAASELVDGTPSVVEVNRVPVMLLRQNGEIYAVQSWCPHAGGPLHKGEIRGAEVVCPWHQSRFNLADGAPLDGPAHSPLRTFEVRERDGRIEVHPSYESQEYPPAPPRPTRDVTTKS